VNVRRLLIAAMVCALSLTACGRTHDDPPAHSREPALTSSSTGTPKVKRIVCSLLTAEERQALAGKSMNIVVPVTASAGTQECQWVHSLNESSNSTIRLVAFSTQDWAKVADRQLRQAMTNNRLSARKLMRLQAGLRKLARGPSKLSDNEICDLYWLLAQASGFHKGSEVVFSSTIGRMRAGYSTGCGDGVLTLLGYGEYGLKTSIPLYQALIDERQKVHERAAKELAEPDKKADDDGTATPTARPSATPTAKPTSKPSATGSATTDAE
jgi:hypothetical protein